MKGTQDPFLTIRRCNTIILLLVSATTLCTIMAIAIAKLSPIAIRSARNLEKVTSDTAEAGPIILEILSNSNTTTANLAKASGDVAKATTPLSSVWFDQKSSRFRARGNQVMGNYQAINPKVGDNRLTHCYEP